MQGGPNSVAIRPQGLLAFQIAPDRPIPPNGAHSEQLPLSSRNLSPPICKAMQKPKASREPVFPTCNLSLEKGTPDRPPLQGEAKDHGGLLLSLRVAFGTSRGLLLLLK